MRTGITGWGTLFALGTSCLLVLTACRAPAHATNGRIGVVAGENFWGDIAAQIGGDRVAVTSIISDAGADPHEYESDVHDAATLADAKVVLENGLGYDDFLAKLISASPGGERTVLTISDVVGVTGSDANPHLWYDPDYVLSAARAIEAALAKASPTDASAFQANLSAFLAGEQRVVDIVDRIKATYAGTRGRLHRAGAGLLARRCRSHPGHPGVVRALDRGRQRSQPRRQRRVREGIDRPHRQGVDLQRSGHRLGHQALA